MMQYYYGAILLAASIQGTTEQSEQYLTAVNGNQKK
jgi:hypothetical protein